MTAAAAADPTAAGPDRRQLGARALGDPTRFRLYRLLEDATAPMGVAELSEAVGVHHNAVRQHLAKLVAAGLVAEEREERHRPGRPRLLYRTTDAPGPWPAQEQTYERLSVVLIDAIRTNRSAFEVGRSVGARLAADAGPDDDPVAVVVRAMANEGFAPVVEPRTDDELDVVLQACPFAAAAAAGPEVVCDLHRGLTEGIAAHTGAVEVLGLEVHDPRTAGCRLRLRRVPGSAD